ncbi:MAG: hypothetical protein ACI828_002812 [Flavobacteriales bacterium]|jgi:hypothetical protein
MNLFYNMHLIIDTGMLLDTDHLNIAVHNIYNALKPERVFILDNKLALDSEVKKLLVKVGFNLSNRTNRQSHGDAKKVKRILNDFLYTVFTVYKIPFSVYYKKLPKHLISPL